MTASERFLVTCLLVVTALYALSGASWIRLYRDCKLEERLAWTEVQRLRATLAAHGIDPDAMETNLSEPEPQETTE